MPQNRERTENQEDREHTLNVALVGVFWGGGLAVIAALLTTSETLFKNSILIFIITIGIIGIIFGVLGYLSFKKCKDLEGLKEMKKDKKEGEDISDEMIVFIDKFHEFCDANKEFSIYNLSRKFNEEIRNMVDILFPEYYIESHFREMDSRLSMVRERCVNLPNIKNEIIFLLRELLNIMESYSSFVKNWKEYVNKTPIQPSNYIKETYTDKLKSNYDILFTRYEEYIKEKYKIFHEDCKIEDYKLPSIWV